MYARGTILHGKNTRLGNLWIVTCDQSFDGSLLWDGTTKTFTPSESYKRDQMSPNMNEATTGAIDLIVGSSNIWPIWAIDIMTMKTTPITVNPSLIPILKDAGLFKDSGVTLRKGIDSPGDTCDHTYKSYQGLTECYDFCTKCDNKIRKTQ